MIAVLCEAKKNEMPNNMPLLNDFHDIYKAQKFEFEQVKPDIVSEETSKGVKECFALFGPEVYKNIMNGTDDVKEKAQPKNIQEERKETAKASPSDDDDWRDESAKAPAKKA